MNALMRQKSLIAAIALAALCAVIWVAVFSQTPRGVLTVAVLDVGQGDSIYIQSPTGNEVLIDGGPDSSVLRDLPQVMRYGDHSIDAVIATHPDADHITGLVDVLARYRVTDFIEPGIEKHTATNDKLESEVTSEHLTHIIARRGMWLDLGDGARLDILYPDWDVTHINLNQDNDGGIVAHLVYGKTSMLFTADTSSNVEDHLIKTASSSELQSTILKVGHHGSKYSSEPAFIDEVHPQIAAISVGAHNTYGHPTPQTLATLKAEGATIYRTDENGTLVFVSDGNTFVKK